MFSFLQSEIGIGCHEEDGLKQINFQLSVYFGNLQCVLGFLAAWLQYSTGLSEHLSFCVCH